MVTNKVNVGEGPDYSSMTELEGIAYTGFHNEKDLPRYHIFDGLFKLVRQRKLKQVGASNVFLHKATGTYWVHTHEVIKGSVREVLDLRHPSRSREETVAAQYGCTGDLAELLVGVSGI
ncbi:MAG: hypothetical protein WCP89_02535 [archaeon]